MSLLHRKRKDFEYLVKAEKSLTGSLSHVWPDFLCSQIASCLTTERFLVSVNDLFEDIAKTFVVTIDKTELERRMYSDIPERASDIPCIEKVLVSKTQDFYSYQILVDGMTSSQRKRIIEMTCDVEREYPFYFAFFIDESGKRATEDVSEDFQCVFDRHEEGRYAPSETPRES